MKLRSLRALALLALVVFVPSMVRAQASKIRPATGAGSMVVANALSCPNIACPIGNVCTFQTFAGTFSSFSRFGALRNKSKVAACLVINTSDSLANGNDGTNDTVCNPASGSAALTQANKNGNSVTVAFSGTACENAAAPNQTLLNTTYTITNSTIKGITEGQGNFSAAFTASAGQFSFSGTTD